MDGRDWDARYSDPELVCGAEPNRFVAVVVAYLQLEAAQRRAALRRAAQVVAAVAASMASSGRRSVPGRRLFPRLVSEGPWEAG